MKKIGIAAASILAMCFIAFIISGLAGGQKETGFYYNELATLPTKQYDEYKDVLNAETVSQSHIHKPVDLRKNFNKKKFKELFSVSAYGFVNEMPTSKL